MTNKRAIILLSQMYLAQFDEEEKEALDIAINALSNEDTIPYITCSNCGKRYRRKVEELIYDKDSDINDYFCHCPNCGKEYTWNDCYWR